MVSERMKPFSKSVWITPAAAGALVPLVMVQARAWTITKGTKAPAAAGVIHTDFEKGFIRSETIAYDDYVSGKGEAGAKLAGKFRLEGKDYVVADGDVMHFRFNT